MRIGRQELLHVSVWLRYPSFIRFRGRSEVEAWIYCRNYTSREVQSIDIPRAFMKLRSNGIRSKLILVAPQLPPSGSRAYDKLTRVLDAYRVEVWEAYSAFRLEGRSSRWNRSIKKHLKEYRSIEDLMDALRWRVKAFLKGLVSHLVDLIALIYPSIRDEIIKSKDRIWMEGLDLETVKYPDAFKNRLRILTLP